MRARLALVAVIALAGCGSSDDLAARLGSGDAQVVHGAELFRART